MKNVLTALACFLSLSVFSQTTFTGAISNEWDNAGNWNNGLPAAGNDATIPLGSTVFNDGDIYNYGTIATAFLRVV